MKIDLYNLSANLVIGALGGVIYVACTHGELASDVYRLQKENKQLRDSIQNITIRK